jgi:YggT family protein
MNMLLNSICSSIIGFLKFYTALLTTRVYLTWFPNINPYTQPFQTLGAMTDPYLKLFRGIIPALLGFDLSPLLAFVFLTFLTDFLTSLIQTTV